MELNTNDFPRELEDIKKKLVHYDKLEKLSVLKDDIIWNLVNGSKSLRQVVIDEKTRKEINEWEKYVNLYK